jgi:hypothetical protein
MKSTTIFLVFGSVIGTQAALTGRGLNSVCSEAPHLVAVGAPTDQQIPEQCQLESKIITQLKSSYAQAASTYCSSFIAKSTTTTVSTTPIVTTTLTPISTLTITPTSTETVGTDTTITRSAPQLSSLAFLFLAHMLQHDHHHNKYDNNLKDHNSDSVLHTTSSQGEA